MPREPKVDGRRARSGRTRARIVRPPPRCSSTRATWPPPSKTSPNRPVSRCKPSTTCSAPNGTCSRRCSTSASPATSNPSSPSNGPGSTPCAREPDPTTAVERLVDATVAIVARATPIYEVLRRAAADPDVNALLDDNRRRRRHDQRQLIEILAQSGHLHPDVDIDTAADIFYALMNEEVFQLLTRDCRWDLNQFQRWATSLLLSQLIGTDTTRATKPHRRDRSTTPTPNPPTHTNGTVPLPQGTA